MPQLIFSNLISLDGYCAGPGGDLSRLPMGPAFYQYNVELLRAAGTLLFGRVTFEMFQSYWPHVGADPSAEPTLGEIAGLCAKMNKLVVSNSVQLPSTAVWSDSEIVSRVRSHARISELKATEGRDLLAFGSHVLMNDLLQHGLVDEVHLLVSNVVLRDGVRAFEDGQPTPLTLIDQRRLAGSDIVALRYSCPSGGRG